MAEIIRGLRERRGVTQKELGEILGVRHTAVQKYECGDVENIPRSSIVKMADYFGVSPCYLMGFDVVGQTATDENRLIQDYRMLNEQGKEQIRLQMVMALNTFQKKPELSDLEKQG